MGISWLCQYEMLLTSFFSCFPINENIWWGLLSGPDFKVGLGAGDWPFLQLMGLFLTPTTIVFQRLSDEKAPREKGLKEIPPKEALLTMVSMVSDSVSPQDTPSHSDGWSENEAYQNAIDKLNYQTAYLRPTSAIWCPNFCRLLLPQQ